MLPRLLISAFLLAHAAIHAGFLSAPRAAAAGGPAWPFDLTGSWALSPLGLDPGIARTLGLALVALTMAGFALAAIAALGIGPSALWAASATVGAIASLALLLVFFHPWLALGIAIDVALLWAVLLADWVPAT